MQTTTLEATVRDQAGKGPARRLRAAGKVPTVAYGIGMENTATLAVQHDDLKRILTSPRGRNTIIDLSVDGGSAHHQVMVKEYRVHPISRRLLHADFMTITDETPVVVEVPFHTTGKSRGVQAGGTLLSSVRTLKLKCLPRAIPSAIEFDVTNLEIDEAVRVSELTLPEGVEVLMAPERRIAEVKPPRVIEVTAEEGEGEDAEGEDAADGEAKPAEGDDS
jgi:large subunit ribosomal protein L25